KSLKGMEIPDIAAQADVFGQEDGQAASDVPSEVVIVDCKDARAVERGVRLNQTSANQRVRAHGSEIRSYHQIPHDRENVRLEHRCAAEEILRVGQLLLESKYVSPRANRHADVQFLVIAVGNVWATGIAAKVVANEG